MSVKVQLDSHARYFTVKPIILVTTLGPGNIPNVAPKTQCMDVGRREEYFAFVCTPKHHTYQNAKANKDEIALVGLTGIPSLVVKPPRIKECRVHLECKVVEIKDLDVASIILGKVVARSASKEASFERGKAKERINLLSNHPLLAYVYPDHYTTIGSATEFIFPKNYKP